MDAEYDDASEPKSLSSSRDPSPNDDHASLTDPDIYFSVHVLEIPVVEVVEVPKPEEVQEGASRLPPASLSSCTPTELSFFFLSQTTTKGSEPDFFSLGSFRTDSWWQLFSRRPRPSRLRRPSKKEFSSRLRCISPSYSTPY